MNFIEEIEGYKPINEQESVDQRVMLNFIYDYPKTVLLRENKIGHITASAIIVNPKHTKMLMIYHNIYKTWTWVGGHMDGEQDLLKLALKEAQEETGLKSFKLLNGIGAIDILHVSRHIKHGKYVGDHLHLNVAYVFEADENATLVVNEEETSGVKWVPLQNVCEHSGEPDIIYVYQKLLSTIGISMSIDKKE